MALPLDPQQAQNLADAEIVERVLSGDINQYALIVERYQQPLYRHALAIVLDHDVATDMVQDAFIRAYTHLESCRDRRRFRGWLFRMLRNRCFDHLKEPRRQHLRLDDAQPVLATADGPAAYAESNEFRLDVTRALEQLQPEQREAFVMHYVDGMSYDAMAELLDASVSALKMRALRARQALSATLSAPSVTKDPVGSSS